MLMDFILIEKEKINMGDIMMIIGNLFQEKHGINLMSVTNLI